MGFPWSAWWELFTAGPDEQWSAIVKFLFTVFLIQARYLIGIWRLLRGHPNEQCAAP